MCSGLPIKAILRSTILKILMLFTSFSSGCDKDQRYNGELLKFHCNLCQRNHSIFCLWSKRERLTKTREVEAGQLCRCDHICHFCACSYDWNSLWHLQQSGSDQVIQIDTNISLISPREPRKLNQTSFWPPFPSSKILSSLSPLKRWRF